MTTSYQNYAYVTIPQPSGYGMTVSNDPNVANWLNVSPGSFRDSNNVMNLTLGINDPTIQGGYTSTPLIINSLGQGLNGLDTGTIANNTLYAVYVIGDSTYQLQTGCILTLASNTQPYMPQGYDSFALIGYACTNDGSLGEGQFWQMQISGNGNARYFYYFVPKSVLSGGTATTLTNVSLANLVPAVAGTMATISANFTPAIAGHILSVSPPSAAGTGQFYSVTGQVAYVPINGIGLTTPYIISGVPTIAYSNTSSSDGAALYVQGFWFFL